MNYKNNYVFPTIFYIIMFRLQLKTNLLNLKITKTGQTIKKQHNFSTHLSKNVNNTNLIS